jgi:hypothetical protein
MLSDWLSLKISLSDANLSMKFNNYLSNILADLSNALQGDLRKRRLKLAYREEADNSYRIIFTQKAVGLGSSFSIKILSQEVTNEFRATWEKARIHNLDHARVIRFNEQGFHADATGFSVSEDLGFQQSLRTSANDDITTYLQRLLRESGIANHAEETDFFERRSSHPVIPILIEKFRTSDLVPDSMYLRNHSSRDTHTFSLVFHYGKFGVSFYFDGQDIHFDASRNHPFSIKKLGGRFPLDELNNLVAAIRKGINVVQNEIDDTAPGFSI